MLKRRLCEAKLGGHNSSCTKKQANLTELLSPHLPWVKRARPSVPDKPCIRKKDEVKLEIFAALCQWKVADKSAKLLSPIPRLIAKHKLGKNYCQDLYKKVVVKGSVANGKSTGRPKEYGPELWREFEKIHEEIQKQTKFKPRSKAIQARLADKLNHLPCAETIRKYSRKSQKQKLGFS